MKGAIQWRRLLIGNFHLSGVSRWAVFGLSFLCAAIFVDLLMPSSRPLFFEAWTESAWDHQVAHIKMASEGIIRLKQNSLVSRATGLRIAAREAMHDNRSAKPFSKIGLQIAKMGQQEQPDNGFWPQMAAGFEVELGKNEDALQDWQSGADASTWQDFQATYLLSQFPQKDNVPSYVYAELLQLRSPAAFQFINQNAIKLWQKVYQKPNTQTAFRFNTLLNGYQMRKHAKSIRAMETGINLCSLILLPPNAVVPPGYHAMLVARLQFADAIRHQFPLNILSVDRMYRENDAEAALTSSTDIAAEQDRLSKTAAVSSCLPGAMLAAIPTVVILGLLALIFSLPHRQSEVNRKLRIGAFLLILAAVAAILVPLSAALTLMTAAVFAVESPRNDRKQKPADLGPLFRYTMVTFGIIWACISSAFFVLNSKPGLALLHISPIAPVYLVSGAYALILAALLVSACLWAFAQRIPTYYVFTKGAALVAASSLWTLLIATVILTPICAYENNHVRTNLHNMVANEPLYYLIK